MTDRVESLRIVVSRAAIRLVGSSHRREDAEIRASLVGIVCPEVACKSYFVFSGADSLEIGQDSLQS
jgi:hypothetical protein